MKKLIILLIATAAANAAIVTDGITYKPFLRGMEKHGEPTIDERFVGLTWACGDEICFAGIDSVLGEVTGP